MLGALAKCAAEIGHPQRVPEYLRRAASVAMAGRPGPVPLALPEDMPRETCGAPDAPAALLVQPGASVDATEALEARLNAARRPLAIIGGDGWTGRACLTFQHFAGGAGLPVPTAFRLQDLSDNESPVHAASLGIGPDASALDPVRPAELVIAVGTRLEDMVG